MTRFWMVRHGPTHAKCMVGWSDLPADLTDLPRLERLNAFLPEGAPVISSDLSRAVSTADALGDRPRLPHDPGLREIHFGAWEMRGYEELERDPGQCDLIRAFWETPGTIRAPGGEGWNDLCQRVQDALNRLDGSAADLVVVCHFGPILAALQRAEGLPPEAVFANRIDNLSVTCLEFGAKAKVRMINHVP